MRGTEEQARIGGRDGLRAVAVVDVEIDDRDPAQAIGLAGMHGADHDIVEQAEPHRGLGFGMMARRPHGTKGVPRLPLHYRIDGGDNGSGCPERGLGRSR